MTCLVATKSRKNDPLILTLFVLETEENYIAST